MLVSFSEHLYICGYKKNKKHRNKLYEIELTVKYIPLLTKLGNFL